MVRTKKSDLKKPAEITFVCGIELELEYNPEILGYIEQGGYHQENSPAFGEYFVAESDGSLDTEKFRDGRTAEIISFPFEINNWKNVLNGFKDEVERKAKLVNYRVNLSDLELKDYICFNNTTGAHLHISFLRKNSSKKKPYSVVYKSKPFAFDATPFYILNVGTIHFLNEITNSIFKRVKKELPEVYPKFRERFFRDYAKKNRDFNPHSARNSCWNLTLNNKEQIEFRSFNLSGVETWDQLFKMYEILFDEFKRVFQKELSGTKKFVETRKIAVSQDEFSEITIKERVVNDEIETKVKEKTIFLN